MEIKRIKPDKRLLEATAPVGINAIAFDERYDIYMLAGMEGDDLLCYAIYSHLKGASHDAFLEYLFTVSEYREKGYASELLKEGEKRLSKIGIDNIMIRQITDPDNAHELNEFITNRGFLPLVLSGRVVCYSLSDMLDTETIQTILSHKKQHPEVKPIEEIGERYLKALLGQYDKTGFFFYREECDDRYSRFYEKDGAIHAAMIASLVDDKAIFVSSVYGDREADNKGMFLILFSEVVYAVLKDTKKRDMDVIFVLNNEATYNGLMKAFNPPGREFLLLEYMKMIGTKGDRE